MTRDEAVARIKEGLGFRSGTGLDAAIILRLQEAQRDLERGKTLPKFLLLLDQTLTLPSGEHKVNFPTGFLRESDDTRIRFFPPSSDMPRFLERKLYIDAVMGNLRTENSTSEESVPLPPSVYVMRHGKSENFIDFITNADRTYTLKWDYYEADTTLTTNIENKWLANAADWIVGFAGRRIAHSARNTSAVETFSEMMTEGRAAVFGEILVEEEASGPYVMGANN